MVGDIVKVKNLERHIILRHGNIKPH